MAPRAHYWCCSRTTGHDARLLHPCGKFSDFSNSEHSTCRCHLLASTRCCDPTLLLDTVSVVAGAFFRCKLLCMTVDIRTYSCFATFFFFTLVALNVSWLSEVSRLLRFLSKDMLNNTQCERGDRHLLATDRSMTTGRTDGLLFAR